MYPQYICVCIGRVLCFGYHILTIACNMTVGGGQHRFVTQITFRQTFRRCNINLVNSLFNFLDHMTTTGYTVAEFSLIKRETKARLESVANIWQRFLRKVCEITKFSLKFVFVN